VNEHTTFHDKIQLIGGKIIPGRTASEARKKDE
jgi:hypothetical protein